jgi:hypothetical protein
VRKADRINCGSAFWLGTIHVAFVMLERKPI